MLGGIVRAKREVETHEFLVPRHDVKRLAARPNLRRDPVDLVVVDITEALGEDEGEDEILVFSRFARAPNRAGGIPEP